MDWICGGGAEPLAEHQGSASLCPLSSGMKSVARFKLETAKRAGKPVISAED